MKIFTAALVVALILVLIATDWAWWSQSINGVASMILLAAVAGGVCFCAGVAHGKRD